MSKIEVVAFDADDTLWHTEHLFQDVQNRLYELMSAYASQADVEAHFHEMEVRNVRLFGYGVKGFTLSMVESAIEISNSQVSATDIHEIVMLGKSILDSPLDLFTGVETVLRDLGPDFRLFLITKGDVLDQRNKIEKSQLEPYFEKTIVVQEKDVETYQQVCVEHKINPQKMVMVGNSLKSDVLPILELGGYAVHIPYHVTAHFEKTDEPVDHPNFRRLDAMSDFAQTVRVFAGTS